MTTSPNGRKTIRDFEGCKLIAYKDQRGIWTVCSGHTGPDVVQGIVCTLDQCDAYLEADLATAEACVNRVVTVPLNQNQFDALVSICYNIGQTAFAHSTLVSLLNQKAYAGASNQFFAWNRVDGVANQGLLNRRTAERTLFLTPSKC